MKLSLLTSLIFTLVAAVPVQQEEAAAVAVAEVAQDVAVAEVEEEPVFLVDNKLTKGHGGRCVRRFASSSSSDDSCDCCEECNKVYYDWMDFYTSTPNFDPLSGTWTYFSLENGFVANNGTLITGCSGGILDTKVYGIYQDGLTVDPIQDNAKYWAYAKTPIPIPPHGDVVVKFEANVQTFNTEENPFPSAIVERNDFRLANGQFMAFDPVTSLYFAFILTNQRVYVMYQRSPTFIPGDKNAADAPTQYAGFSFVIPVKIRRVCDWHSLELVFYGDSREVGYQVDGQEVFIINQVGYLLDRDYMVEDYGGLEVKVWPESIYYGFGSFTELDAYPACQRTESCRACRYPFIREALVKLNNGNLFTPYNPIFGPTTPAVYWDTVSLAQNKIWGQGSVSKIRKLIAYQRVPVC